MEGKEGKQFKYAQTRSCRPIWREKVGSSVSEKGSAGRDSDGNGNAELTAKGASSVRRSTESLTTRENKGDISTNFGKGGEGTS